MRRAATCTSVARRLDLDRHGNRVDADAAKLFAARVGKEIADRAIQVLGGYGYMGEYVVERLWRDAKLLETAAARWKRTRRTSPRTSPARPTW